jgi:hypothetical protein
VFGSQNQQGVVGVLDDRAWEVIDEGMQEPVLRTFHGNKAGEQVGDSEIQVRGQRVALAQSIFARDPSPGDPVE